VNMTRDASQSTLKGRPQGRGARAFTKVLELFARQDYVEEAWRIVDPVLEATTPVLVYERTHGGLRRLIGGSFLPEGGTFQFQRNRTTSIWFSNCTLLGYDPCGTPSGALRPEKPVGHAGSVLICLICSRLCCERARFLGSGDGYGNTCHPTGMGIVAPVAFLEFLSTATGTGIISREGRYDVFHHASNAAKSVLRTHSDRFCLLAFAALSNARNSSVVALMRSISAMAFPLGSLGRPTGLGLGCFGIGSELLNDCGSNSHEWGYGGVDVQHGNVPLWIIRVVRFVRPCVYPVGLGMAKQVEDFYDSLPYRLAFKYLMDVHTFTVRSLPTVKLVNDRPEYFDIVHAVASTKSATLHVELDTPAAIAGVQRRVL
jgi:hypothetical protein